MTGFVKVNRLSGCQKPAVVSLAAKCSKHMTLTCLSNCEKYTNTVDYILNSDVAPLFVSICHAWQSDFSTWVQ